MLRISLAMAAMIVSMPVYATDAPAALQSAASVPPKRGQLLVDANGARLGIIDAISADGTVGVIVGTDYRHIPSATVTNVDGKAQTTLTKKDVKALR